MAFIYTVLFSRPTYVATNTDNETRGLKITRKQSTFGGTCQPTNDLCPLAALVRLSSCQSAVSVLLWSRGAAHGLIGVAWSCSTWKKSQCHLVTLGHAAKLLHGGEGGLELACCQGRVCVEHRGDESLCCSTLSPYLPPVPPSPSSLSHTPPSTSPITNTVIIHLWRVGHLQ